MGKVIELSDYRTVPALQLREGFVLEAGPLPVMVVKHVCEGHVVGEERVISEALLREMLDGMP